MEKFVSILNYSFLILSALGLLCFFKKKGKEGKILISLAWISFLIENLINKQWIESALIFLLLLIGVILFAVGRHHNFDA